MAQFISKFNYFRKPSDDAKAPPKTFLNEFADEAEFIQFAADSLPEGDIPPEKEDFNLGKAIADYMDGLDPQHKSQVHALIGEVCTITHLEFSSGIPLKVRYANGDEVVIKLSKIHNAANKI